MKTHLLILLFCFSGVALNSQTTVILLLPDNCNVPSEIEEPPVVISESVLKIFPNPNTGIFYLTAEFMSEIGKANIRISDFTGKVIYTESVYCDSKKLIKQINISELSPGSYVIELKSDKQKLSAKLLIK